MSFTAILMANIALPQSSLAITGNAFCHFRLVRHTYFKPEVLFCLVSNEGLVKRLLLLYNGTEKQQQLFNQSFKVKILPLVICGPGDVHTNTHTHVHTHTCINSQMKVISRNQARAWFKFEVP